jgi:hypothetical protein
MSIISCRSLGGTIASLVLSAMLTGSFSAEAVIQPGTLGVTSSRGNLILSFPTVSPGYYALQTSRDLQHWNNSPFGVVGDGTVKSITLSNATFGGQGFYRYQLQKSVLLTLPQSSAFGILGYSCGGIKETVSAGLSLVNGLPTGVVGLSTSCGGSGRDGGGHVTTYTAAALVVWDFSGAAIAAMPLANGITIPATTPNDGLGEVIYNVGAETYLTVPIPAAPGNPAVLQTGDEFQVSWKPNIGNPAAILSSLITATPVGGNGAILTNIVTGPATNGVVPLLQPLTTYEITVVNTTIGGSSPASAPLNVTTQPATILPSAPPGVTAAWAVLDPSGTTDTLVASWLPADPGNSPVDQYLVVISSDAGTTYSQTAPGTALTAYFGVDFTPNWTVTVQAHNAAGWGPVSKSVGLGGL